MNTPALHGGLCTRILFCHILVTYSFFGVAQVLGGGGRCSPLPYIARSYIFPWGHFLRSERCSFWSYFKQASFQSIFNTVSSRTEVFLVLFLLGFQPDEEMSEVFKTEFQMRLLWGSKGAQVNQTDRYEKFNQILTALSRKLEPPPVKQMEFW